MQGHPDVIDYLNTLLTGELAARDQYFVHSRMYEDWGFATTVPEMFAADLRLEYKVRAALCKGIALCEQHKDYVSRDMLRIQLADTEEDHTYWLEKQLGLIKAIGLQNYLQSQF